MQISRYVYALPLLLAGCGQPAENNAAMAINAAEPAAPSPTPSVASTIRGPELATSPAAAEAKQVVERYYALIAQKRYAAARKLWGSGGAESGGDAAAFAKAFRRYTSFTAKVGEPTDIKSSDGRQYVSVHVTAQVRTAGDAHSRTLDGPVMLRRAADSTESDPDKRDWRIWGSDVRVHR